VCALGEQLNISICQK